jgi:hypothetical protein
MLMLASQVKGLVTESAQRVSICTFVPGKQVN